MKRKKLIKTIKSNGCVFVRHGGNHDWYRNPQTGKSQPIPRHTELKKVSQKESLKDYRKDVSNNAAAQGPLVSSRPVSKS